jgi:hypothetical protein
MRRSLFIENIVLANPSLVIKRKNQKIKSSGLDFNLHEYLQVIHEETNTVIHELRLEHFRLENFSLKILTDQDRYFFIDRVFMEINELFANVQGNKISGNYELEGGIHLWLDKPIIVYPDSNLRVNLDSLDWLSQKHRLSIENISLFQKGQKIHICCPPVQLTVAYHDPQECGTICGRLALSCVRWRRRRRS